MRKEFLTVMKNSMPFFQVLQDENRLEIIGILLETEKMNVSELTEKLTISRPAVSHHLKALLQAELVLVEKQGKERLYRLNKPCIRDTVETFYRIFNQL